MLTPVIEDNDLFDKREFEKALAADTPSLSLFKNAIYNGNRYLVDQFEMGKPVEELVHNRARQHGPCRN